MFSFVFCSWDSVLNWHVCFQSAYLRVWFVWVRKCVVVPCAIWHPLCWALLSIITTVYHVTTSIGAIFSSISSTNRSFDLQDRYVQVGHICSDVVKLKTWNSPKKSLCVKSILQPLSQSSFPFSLIKLSHVIRTRWFLVPWRGDRRCTCCRCCTPRRLRCPWRWRRRSSCSWCATLQNPTIWSKISKQLLFNCVCVTFSSLQGSCTGDGARSFT